MAIHEPKLAKEVYENNFVFAQGRSFLARGYIKILGADSSPKKKRLVILGMCNIWLAD
jgi:hypothetical protein